MSDEEKIIDLKTSPKVWAEHGEIRPVDFAQQMDCTPALCMVAVAGESPGQREHAGQVGDCLSRWETAKIYSKSKPYSYASFGEKLLTFLVEFHIIMPN